MDFSKIKGNANKMFRSQLFWLQACAVGIWLLVFQNYFGGEDSVDGNAQRVYVVGGNISADVGNTVDINIESVNGYRDAFYGPSFDGNYDAIHVYTGR